MNLKRIVSRRNAATFTFPKGWITKAQAAEQLDCSEERVNEVLKHALRAGDIERKEFPVWDAALGRLVRITGYRETGHDSPADTRPKTTTQPKPEIALSMTADVLRRIEAFVQANGGPKVVTAGRVRSQVRVRKGGHRFPIPLSQIEAALAKMR